IDDLVAQVEALAEAGAVGGANEWRAPAAGEIRDAHREAQRILKAHVRPPLHPDTFTGKVDAVLLHPVAGLVILLGLLFVMFQAVFSWGKSVGDLIGDGFTALAAFVAAHLPAGLLASFLSDGVISGVGSVIVFL